MEEMEILGFDPSQLSVFNQNDAPKQQSFNSNVYRTRPSDVKEEIDKEHIYRCTIKIVYNPFNYRESILEQQAYWLEDAEGGFQVISSLTNNDTSCPIFKAWKKCHYADPSKVTDADEKLRLTALAKQALSEEDGGLALFDKRFTRYCVVQILKDKNQPELVNKFMLWKMPKAVYEMVQAKIKPTSKEKAPVPVMDFLFGRSLDIEVKPGPGKPGDKRYTRETSYTAEWSDDTVLCKNVDGSPLLNDDENEILEKYVSAAKKIWKESDEKLRNDMTATLNADPNTLKLGEIYKKVRETIKESCPNLIDELGYKPWSEKVTERVEKWINLVLSCKNPKAEIVVIETPKDENKENKNESTETKVLEFDTKPVETPTPSSDSDDDLPF